MLREVARVLADDLGKRVVVVDTSNEIAGDGDIPHPGIGDARRMQVRTPTEQHAVMIEAVENHMPEVIVIDEIGTELEAAAARTIAERGVQLVGTAHGNTLDNLMLNPTLSDLIGGIQTVTLGDEEARRRGTQKSVLERKAPPDLRRGGRDRGARPGHRPPQRGRDGGRHPARPHGPARVALAGRGGRGPGRHQVRLPHPRVGRRVAVRHARDRRCPRLVQPARRRVRAPVPARRTVAGGRRAAGRAARDRGGAPRHGPIRRRNPAPARSAAPGRPGWRASDRWPCSRTA